MGSLDLTLGLLLPPNFASQSTLLGRWYMDRKTRNWLVAPLISVNPVTNGTQGKVVALSYSYRVGNERYGGHQATDDQTLANKRGLPALVRYDPDRPDRSWIP
jgi:hypothetical protein